MIKLSAFADEATASFDEQLRTLCELGVGYIELRGLDGLNVTRLTEDAAREYKRKLDLYGIKVSAIGSPIGKISINGDIEAHMDLLRHVSRLANIFETERIRVFSFYDAYDEGARVCSTLREMVAIAGEYGVTLCHENEKRIYGDTAERVRELISSVEGLCFVYDPANFIESGEPSEKTLPLFPEMDYFHIKDAIMESGAIVPAGAGDGRIPELVSMMTEGDYILTVEPHLMVFEGYSEFDDTVMQNKYVYPTNKDAFRAAVDAIKEVILASGFVECEGGYVARR